MDWRAKWKLGTWEVVDKIPVSYNIGHLAAAHGDTKHPAGKYLIALNKLDGPALGDVSSASVRRTAMHNLT